MAIHKAFSPTIVVRKGSAPMYANLEMISTSCTILYCYVIIYPLLT